MNTAVAVECPECGADAVLDEGGAAYSCKYCGSYNVWNSGLQQYSLKAATSDEARIKLGQLRLDFNEETFLSCIDNLDDDAIALFLVAGAERWGSASLHKAIEHRNPELVRALLSKGVRLRPSEALVKCLKADLPDELIADFGPFEQDASVAALTHFVETEDLESVSRILKLASPDLNVPINAKEPIESWFRKGDPQTPLIMSFANKNVSMSKLFIEHGAGLIGNRDGVRKGFARAEALYLLSLAARRNDPEMLELVLGFGFESEEWMGIALREAANANATECIRFLRSKGASIGTEGIKQAADAVCNNEEARLTGFLAAGLDPNQTVLVRGKPASGQLSGSICDRDRAVSLLRISLLRSALGANRALRSAGAKSHPADLFDKTILAGFSLFVFCFTAAILGFFVDNLSFRLIVLMAVGWFLVPAVARRYYRRRFREHSVWLKERPI